MDQWVALLSRALHTRLAASTFGKYATILHIQHPIASSQIADLLIRPSKDAHDCLDPLAPLYVQALLQADLIDIPTVLGALLRYSIYSPEPVKLEGSKSDAGDKKPRGMRWKRSWIHDEMMFYGMTTAVSSGAKPKAGKESVNFINILTAWMKLLVTVANTEDVMNTIDSNQDTNEYNMAYFRGVVAVRISLGILLVAASESAKLLAVLKKGCPKDLIKDFSQTLAAFSPLLIQSNAPIAERLESFRSRVLVPLEPIDKKAQAASDEIDLLIDSTMAMGMDSIPVMDLPVMNTRAGLYVYLHSLLVAKPIIDDRAIFTYLHNRYQGDLQSTCIDLILASFDILSNAIFRNESTQTTILLRSFLINKVPLLLANLSTSMFQPLTAEYCITQALSHVDTNAFPTFSSMFDESSPSGNMFSDSVRQDFCFACCLHGLIPEDSIERLLGEIPMQTLPTGGRYIKEELVQQCLLDPERTESLLEELELMDGNVGAVAQALTGVIGQYCQNKDTMSLKTLCSHLARKPSSLDIILLFEKSTAILQPLCEYLDGWRYDEDQGEYQPVYEEFGCILLLVLAFVYRYDLSTVDLGLHANDSFVAKLLVRGALSKSMDELSEQERGHLDGWIRGLFNAEGGGLGDETMSACPPQEFYLLVPTLFSQIVLACSTGHLNDEGLKGGLEYLVDTFLLPSLVGAITWLAHHLWESRGDSNAVIQILQTLIKPGSISNEASLMLASILDIVAKPLEHSLRSLQRSEPSRQDVEPLSKALKPHLSFSRTGGSDHTELESWTGQHGGGLASSIRHTIQSMVQWSLTPGTNITPTSYTHRQILVGVRMIGARRVLQAILEEIKAQAEAGNGSVVLDAAVAIICAPDARSPMPTALLTMLDEPSAAPQPLQRRLNLRDTLKTEAENAAKIHKTDVIQAEMIIRLYRRVEAQMTVPMEIQAQQNMLQHALGGMDVGNGALDGGLEDGGIGDLNSAQLGLGAGGLMGGAQDIDGDMLSLGMGDGMMGVDGDDFADLKMEF